MCFFSKKKKKKKITTESSPFFLTEKCIAAWGGMKVDFAWPTPLDNMVTYDRHMSPPPSSSCPQKIHLHHLPHLQTPKVTFRCASAALADPHTALPSSLFSVCLPCQAEKKNLLYVCCKNPQLTLYPNSMHTHNHIDTQARMDTHSAYTLADRNTSGEPVKIWVAQQVSESTQIDVLCWPWVIMDGNNWKGWYQGRKHCCRSSVFVRTCLMMLRFEVKYLLWIIVQQVLLSEDAFLMDPCLASNKCTQNPSAYVTFFWLPCSRSTSMLDAL